MLVASPSPGTCSPRVEMGPSLRAVGACGREKMESLPTASQPSCKAQGPSGGCVPSIAVWGPGCPQECPPDPYVLEDIRWGEMLCLDWLWLGGPELSL